MIRPLFAATLLASTALLGTPVLAENSKPQPVPYVDTIPAARDIAYPGTITLDVDATDTKRGIFTVKETIPVREAGPMVLLYPKWLPGAHSPRGEIEKLAALKISANGKPVPWKRDPVDVFAFHIDVPKGAKNIDIDLKFLSATKADQGRIVVTPRMLSLQFNSMSLYPAGYFTRQIPIKASVRYPDGWTAASALPSKLVGSTYAYEKTNYEVLVDSPVLAGRYFKRWELSPRVNLNVVADTPEELVATPEQIDVHKKLVDQAVRNFGAQHYDNYEFLLSISDDLGGIGLEHHRSSENGVKPGYFTKWKDGPGSRNLLPHEFTHSWDGKFRRGADLWTPDFRTPMRGSLLWVYEGQTQFWGYVLQARSGIVSKQDTLDMYASILASLDNRPARDWRPMVDTTNDPVMSQRKPKGWTSYQRSEDYYNEGLLIWMEVDSILRKQSGGTKSIDDFAKAFFGINDGDWGQVTYTFDDVVATLNAIQPYDWNGFLGTRINETGAPAPLGGFVANGYRLIYTDEPTPAFKNSETTGKKTDLTYSLGLVIDKDGEITSVGWDSPAYKSGLDIGTKVMAVNDLAYSDTVLKAAIVAAKTSKDSIRLLVKNGERLDTVSIDYHGGPRYPRLEKIGTGEGGLDKLLSPR
ncbi:M61 family metallopeptidase [Sphingomonas sp. So64.6b]|uniref:M61 family metallopeptidase n=1 Tax=Sphingomonas sp. So64.6b TaxID=2997354 RepID=UPI00160024BB|nr:M61 family metallopeptidase [Sphingomonas sp. So64.6b]QNA86215.1 M61 family metallopeptidase [Sphingomonas sp. So64.6b]